MKKAMLMYEQDNVATAICNINKGDKVQVVTQNLENYDTLTSLEDIPLGNKIALKDISSNDLMIKYGEALGKVIKDIPKGRLVHVHNVRSLTLDIPDDIISEIIKQMNIQLEGK